MSHRIHGTCIFTYIYHEKSSIHVGKYLPVCIDAMGYGCFFNLHQVLQVWMEIQWSCNNSSTRKQPLGWQSRRAMLSIPDGHHLSGEIMKNVPSWESNMWVFPKIGGTLKSSILIFLIGFSIINHPFWGSSILGNPHNNLFISWQYFGSTLGLYIWLTKPRATPKTSKQVA